MNRAAARSKGARKLRAAGVAVPGSDPSARTAKPAGRGSRARTARPDPLVQAVLDATTDDLPPGVRLVAARQARGLLDAAELAAWQGCRSEGLSWGELARLTQMGRSGAQQRSRKLSERLGP